jgi:hypothetical protein
MRHGIATGVSAAETAVILWFSLTVDTESKSSGASNLRQLIDG